MARGDELLTVREVAARLKVGEETIRRWIRAGRLRAWMPGGEKIGYRVAESELQRFVGEEQQEKRPRRSQRRLTPRPNPPRW